MSRSLSCIRHALTRSHRLRLSAAAVPLPSPFFVLSRSVVTVANAEGELLLPAATPPAHSRVFDSARKKQLLYRSRQRGWLELDLILGSWAERHVFTLSDDELQQFESIVRRENPDLVRWIINRQPLPDDVDCPVMRRLIDYTHGEGKTWIRKKGNQA